MPSISEHLNKNAMMDLPEAGALLNMGSTVSFVQ
jgi:hypothetical protein